LTKLSWFSRTGFGRRIFCFFGLEKLDDVTAFIFPPLLRFFFLLLFFLGEPRLVRPVLLFDFYLPLYRSVEGIFPFGIFSSVVTVTALFYRVTHLSLVFTHIFVTISRFY